MKYKEVNKLAYDGNARGFELRSFDYLRNYILEDANLFVDTLQGPNVIDIGSGPGRDSVFLAENNLKPLCFDISLEMIKLCRDKGLETVVGDLEMMPFSESSFDGAWAYTSLLHVPKIIFPSILQGIKRILKPNGLFYLGMKEGDFEGFISRNITPQCKTQRFYSLYKEDELKDILSEDFDILHNSKVVLGDSTFLNYLLKGKGFG